VSLSSAIEISTHDKVFAIGGRALWMDAMHVAGEVFLTVVKRDYPITRGKTLVVPEFLRFDDHWPWFWLSSNETHMSKSGLQYEIQHWMK
jgi:hypothetical protein